MAKKTSSRLRALSSSQPRDTAPRFIPGDDGGGPILGRWAFFLASTIALALLTGGAVLFGTAKIERGLEERVSAGLRAAGVDGVVVEASGRDLLLSGFVDDETQLESIPRAVAPTEGVRSVDAELRVKVGAIEVGDVAADPMRFQWSDGTMTVAGTVSSERARSGIIGAMETALDYTLDTSRLVVREGVGDESAWISAALSALRDTAEAVPEGEMVVNPNTGVAQVSAEFDSRQDRADLTRQVEDLLAASPLDFVSGFTLAEAPPPPPREQVVELQSNLDELIEGKVVEFETNSDRLTDEGAGLLDEVLEALRLFPNVPVEIAGHADAQGTDEFNLDLSTRRAEAVLAYLVDRGEDPGRFVVIGYGESRPIADNDTEEGRARNRRIEFIALDE